jgi:hypothetical protein
MGLKDEAYGLNLLIVFWLQIELQQHEYFPKCFMFVLSTQFFNIYITTSY